MDLFVVCAEFSGIEKLEILAVKEGLCSYLLSEIHCGTWTEEEGAKLVFDALLQVKEPAILWASEVLDKTQLKGLVADLNGMGCKITLAAGSHPDMREHEAHAWSDCANYAQFG